MIGRLKGTVIERRPPCLLLDVAGTGYELEAPMTSFAVIPEPGGEAVLYTHLLQRDDALLLYAFAHETDRHLFRCLLRVSGVGARLALTILSGMEAFEFAACIQNEDVSRLCALPGVGKKNRRPADAGIA